MGARRVINGNNSLQTWSTEMIHFRLPEHFIPIKQPLDLPKPPFSLGFTSKMAIPAGLWEYGCAPCDQRKSFTSNFRNTSFPSSSRWTFQNLHFLLCSVIPLVDFHLKSNEDWPIESAQSRIINRNQMKMQQSNMIIIHLANSHLIKWNPCNAQNLLDSCVLSDFHLKSNVNPPIEYSHMCIILCNRMKAASEKNQLANSHLDSNGNPPMMNSHSVNWKLSFVKCKSK